MRYFFSTLFLLSIGCVSAQVTLSADGPGNTYNLITSVLAPGQNPIEVPDCNHEDFGDHIEEVFDENLNTYVFRFVLHVEPDNDRCITFDRQRNEIKSYSPSPDNLLGVFGEKVIYKWKFKLPDGFQSSPSFTHIHQLKPVGGEFAKTPLITLTTRKSNPDRLELRYADEGSQTTLSQTPLEQFIGEWIEVTEVITYEDNGTYELSLVRMSDKEELFSWVDLDIDTWRTGTEFVRPKWGIYRSLDEAEDLRDEEVFFNDFSIEEISTTSSKEEEFSQIILSNPVNKNLFIQNIPTSVQDIQIFNMSGSAIFNEKTNNQSSVNINVSNYESGTYVVLFKGNNVNQSRLFIIQ